MANELTVNKLISTFGFKIEKGSAQKVEQEIKRLKKKLQGLEASVLTSANREAKKVRQKAQKDEYDSHVKLLDKKHAAERKSLRRLNELKKREVLAFQKEQVKIFKGKATRAKGNIQSFIDDTIVGRKDPDAVRMAKEYAKEEKEAARAAREELRKSAKEERDLYRDKLKALQSQIKHQASLVRAYRETNQLKRIHAQHEKEVLEVKADQLRYGLKQEQVEERINALIAKRDTLLAKARTAPTGGGGAAVASRIGAAEGAGLLSAAGKLGSGLMPTLAAGGAGFGSVFAIQSIFKGTATLDAFESAMASVLGTTKAAREELNFYLTTAREMKAPLISGAKAYRNFITGAVGANIELEKARELYKGLAKFSRVAGVSQDDMNGALRAFTQIASKGQLYREELQQQLAERIPGAVSMVAEGLGVSTSELNDMMQRGEITGEMAFDAFIKGFNERVSDEDLAGAMQNLPSMWQGLINSVEQFVMDLRELGSSESMRNIIGNVTEFVNGFRKVAVPAIMVLVKALELLTDVLGNEFVGFIAGALLARMAVGKLAGVFLSLVTKGLVGKFVRSLTLATAVSFNAAGAFGVLSTAATAAGAAMKRFWLAAFGPYTLIGAGIALLADEIEKAFSGNEKRSIIDIVLREPLNKWMSDLLGTDVKIFNLIFGSVPTLIADSVNMIKEHIGSVFNGIVDGWNWLKNKIPFLGDDEDKPSFKIPSLSFNPNSYLNPTQRVLGQISSDVNRNFDKVKKFGVADGNGGVFFSQMVADRGAAAIKSMQMSGASAEKIALAKQQLEKQGGQPVTVNQNINIQVDGTKDPLLVSKAIRQELEKYSGMGVQSTPAGFN
jgi:tape measure domain-containing protein